jgi:tRNA G37 N-methylase Trm5
MSYLDNTLTAESVFWEFGAAWGYFSLSAATRVRQVCSFEMMDIRVECLQTSAEANGFDNITVIDDKLDDETEFTKYPYPDTVLVDIEGWEYVVLSSALEQLPDVSSWIVEVHSSMEGVEFDDPIKEMETLFETAGYTTDVLNEWSDKNVHIAAEKE